MTTHSPNTEQRERADLCAWLREHSSGAYRQCAVAADLIERLATQAATEPLNIVAIAKAAFDAVIEDAATGEVDPDSAEARHNESFQAGELAGIMALKRAILAATQAAPASPEPATVGEDAQFAQNVLEWNRSNPEPLIKIGSEYAVALQLWGWIPRAPASPNTGAVSLFDRKLGHLQSQGFEVVGRILHKDGQYALFDESCRWLTQPQYWRLMHEQDGSLFATPSPSKGGELAAARELIAAFESSMEGCRDQSWAEWENGHGENVGKRIEEARTAYAASKGGEAVDKCALSDAELADPELVRGYIEGCNHSFRLAMDEIRRLRGGEADSAAEGREAETKAQYERRRFERN